MGIKVRSYLTILTLILTLIVSGCSNDNSTSQYHKSAKEFDNMYFEIVECIDLGNTLKSLEQLQNEENIKKIEELGTLVKDIEKNLPKDSEQLYNTFNERYKNLVFLKESYPKFERITVDDKIKINSILISIGLDKENWNDKNSSIIWD
ncbi:MAG: hypothetical protein ACYDG2_23860 [Ruminiclostridium sp.]